jgi:NADP-dependent 3-hydroxy acid dehydrogenase YdfG
LPGDVTDLDTQKAAIAAFVDKTGGLDAAFANAGMGLSAAGTDNGDPEEWEQMIGVNVLGVLWTVMAAMPHLKDRAGHLLLTGSAAGRRHIAGSVYGASKWFVHGYGGNLSEEMKTFGGRCTVIAPGMVDTAFFDEPKPDKLQPDDVARAALFALEADPRCAVNEIFLMPTQ